MNAASTSRVRMQPDARVRVTVDPYTSVLALACSAVAARMRGRDVPLLTRLSERELRAVAGLVVPGSSVAPEALTPADLGRDTTLADELARLRSMSAAELHADIDATYAGSPPEHWVRVAGQGRRWLGDLSDALDAVWQLVEPAWYAQARRRGRETERVGTAAARGALDVALARAHPRGRVTDGVLEFPDPEATELDAERRTVVLAPLLSGVNVSISNLDRPGIVWFGYPTPVLRTEDESALVALLTPVRATMLRLLGTEWTMSRLAAEVGLAPATATHQISALVADGLATRRRDGRHTLVARTERGDGLLELYGVTDLPSRVVREAIGPGTVRPARVVEERPSAS